MNLEEDLRDWINEELKLLEKVWHYTSPLGYNEGYLEGKQHCLRDLLEKLDERGTRT